MSARRFCARLPLIVGGALVLLGAGPLASHAQDVPPGALHPRPVAIGVGLRGSIMSVADGESSLAGTVSALLSVHALRGWEIEGFHTLTEGTRSPFEPPVLRVTGGLLRYTWREGKSVRPWLAGGIGLLEVEEQDPNTCGPPSCMYEGGLHFVEGTRRVAIVAVGAELNPADLARFRIDLRVYRPRSESPDGSSNNDTRADLGVGIVLRF